MADLDATDISDALDPNALLEGEEPESMYLEDAVHWIAVYTELVGLKKELIARIGSLTGRMTEDAAQAAEFDDKLLRAEAARFQSRLDFWVERAQRLTEDRLRTGGSHGNG